MITFKIKTWSCDSVDCTYVQDFEMTKENADLHFNNSEKFRSNNVQAGECPSCHLKGGTSTLSLETDNAKKSGMSIMEQEDIDAKRVKLESEDSKTLDGKELRLETDEENAKRVAGEADGDSVLEAELIALPNQTLEFAKYRDETAREKANRIDEIIGSMKLQTPEEISALRAKYEDK